MKPISYLKSALGAGVLAAGLLASGNASAVALPAVNTCTFSAISADFPLLCYTTSSGAELYIASSHDDFHSYGVAAINEFVGMGFTDLQAFSNGLGSGNILKLFTYNSATNGGFPDANSGTPTGGSNQSFSGLWPVSNQTFSIADLKGYLGGATSPVFGFDFGEPQKTGQFLNVNGYFDIVRNGTIVDTFAFDNQVNHAYDAASVVTAPVDQYIFWRDTNNPSCTGNGVSLVNASTPGFCKKSISNVLGNGAAEFYAYATTFNVDDFLGTDLMVFHLYMNSLDGTGEELFLNNGVTPPTRVPEPSPMALLGLGLLALGALRRRAA